MFNEKKTKSVQLETLAGVFLIIRKMDSLRDIERATKKGDEEASFPELLNFASRAQTLISELLLLSGRIPHEFHDRLYDPVLFDLTYFESPDVLEAKIEGNVELEALEDKLRETCAVFMQRFFILANGIIIYYQELLKYLNNLHEGMDVQSTLERVLENGTGRQLLTESLALFGCLLLLMEHHMSGSVREKLVVAHIRHDRCFNAPNLEAICLLSRVHMSSTSHSSSAMVSVQKPEDLFMRFPFPKQVVDSVISRLRDCDMYNRTCHYPDPEHRSVALALQAGCLYVILFYSPELLHNGIVMREIVDRFFKDLWVIPIFMYFTVDLSLSWDAYKGAKVSLSSCLSPVYIRDLCQLHCMKVKDLMSELHLALSEGAITRDYVLNNSQSLLSLVRNCNVSLRWLLLHRSSNDKKTREIVTSAGIAHKIEEETLISLLVNTSQFEFEVKQLYMELLEGKETLWQENKSRASECIEELSEYYSGSRALLWKIKDENLKDWLKNSSLEVLSLDYTNIGNANRKLYHVISTLKEVEQFHEIKRNFQIKQHISVIQKYLQDMLQTLNLHVDTLSTFSVVTDAICTWGFIRNITEKLFKKIERDSFIVLNFHSLFLKFRSVLDTPLLRLSQNRSPDLPYVSAYYSSEYMAHICAILEIIPVILFKILDDEVACTLQPIYLPKRIERDDLEDFIKLDQQLHLAKKFDQISIISQGVVVISRTLFDLIGLDVKKFIEGKMRKELSKRFEDKLKSFFLSPSVGPEELEMNVQKLMTYVRSQLHLMECFQDLIHIQGTRIWEEEFTCFLKNCARKECDDFVSQKQDSIFMHVQVNDFSNAQTFLGHLLRQILKLTSPSRSMYIEPMSGWFDAEGHELLGLRFFDLLEECVGPVGLASLDSLLAFTVLENLEHAIRSLKKLVDTSCLEELQMLNTALGPATSLPSLEWSSSKQMTKFMNTSWEPLVESLARIGQLQLLRCLITLKLKSACKVKAGLISSAVGGVTASVSSQKDKILEGTKTENGAMELFLNELGKQGMLCGFCSPFQTLYISEDPPPFLSRCASILTISQLPRYVLDTHLGTLTSRLKKVSLDFSPLVMGLGTFLGQFHPTYLIQYVQYMGQYIRITAATAFGAIHEPEKGSADPTSEVLKATFWLMYFCKHMEISKDVVDSCLPPSMFAVLQP